MSLAVEHASMPGGAVPVDRMPGHWLLASLGKRVLRPGGRELTDQLIGTLDIGPSDHVVEVAPGLGSTTRIVLERCPASYVGVDRDPDAADLVAGGLAGENRSMVHAPASATGLETSSADVVFGEAYSTMQPASRKECILTELARITRPGGRIAVHEIALTPEDIDPALAASIAAEMTRAIKANITPLVTSGWVGLVEHAGFEVTDRFAAPLRLLEPGRLVADEGVSGALRFASRVARRPDARRRVLAMRAVMHDNREHLRACGLVAVRR